MKTFGNILIADDNIDFLNAMKMMLVRDFASVEIVKNPNLIPRKLEDFDFDVILLDMNFSRGQTSGNEGLFWMRKIHETLPETSVVLITAFSEVELAVNAMKEGAADFIEKSWENEKILATIHAAAKVSQAKRETSKVRKANAHLTEELRSQHRIFISDSPEMKNIYQLVNKVASTDANILLLGKNGTGKEVIAHEIHNRSKRSKEVFVSVNISAIPETLFESELFGYVKGAFTGANQDKTGKFEIAQGGTLFLDEIGDLSPNLQTKLLSAIQSRTICRLGSHKIISLDVRLICATNQSIYEKAETGSFREDLLYRINNIQIEIPPLRQRLADILPMAHFFLDEFSLKYGKTGVKIGEAAAEKLMNHPWKGNVRELRSVIEKAVIISESKLIQTKDLMLNTHEKKRMLTVDSFNLIENEKRIILRALERFQGNISETAKSLGVNRTTLYNKMKRYDIQ